MADMNARCSNIAARWHCNLCGCEMEIRIGDLNHCAVRDLLREHLDGMALHSPPESIHALAPDALAAPDITFWCVWANGELLGCGALKELTAQHGEIKSMRTSARHLRRGVGSFMLRHLIAQATHRAYRRLSLETGSGDAFAAAHQLYERFGFRRCGPFGSYIEDPFSVFMSMELA